LRAYKELGIPVSYSIKYVVSTNLHRRHLDEFQRAEIALKYKLYRKIARSRYDASHFTSETGRAAINKRWDEEQNNGFSDDEGAAGDEGGDGNEIPSLSADRGRIGGHKGSATNQELAEQFGVSTSTLDRVDTILQDGTPEQVQSEKLKDKLSSQQTENPAQLRRDNLKLINKDFRTITAEDIPDGSADLVLVLDFSEPRIREDEGGQ
jgi:hypothetical protein